jgi:ABC-type Mn2+/Zn2+ transport system permease subunit
MSEILDLLLKSLSYSFIQKALLCGVLISVTFSMLGSFLVLRKYSLISDGLSHVSFATIAFSLLIGASPVLLSIPLVLAASFLITKLTEKTFIYQDSAIGLVSASSLALGVIIVSVSKGFNIDVYSYLFGSILAITDLEVILALIITVITAVLLILFFHELFVITYDIAYAKVLKINTGFINTIFMMLVSVSIVIGVKVVGALLVSSLIIFPAITALQVSKNFMMMIIISMIVSALSVLIGIFSAFVFNLPAGASIVLVNLSFFILFFLVNKVYKIK